MRQQVLDILSDLEWHRGAYLATQTTWRFGGVIGELRDEGYTIDKRLYDSTTGEDEYRLVSLERGKVRMPHARVDFSLAEARWIHGLFSALELLGMVPAEHIAAKIKKSLQNAEKEWALRQKKEIK